MATVWYSRYPNAEVPLQLLVFGALLAFSRASVDGDRFFAPIAAVLLTLSAFAHLTGVLAIGAVGLVSVLSLFDRRTPQLSFLLPLIAGTIAVLIYYVTVMWPYVEIQVSFFRDRVPLFAPVAGLALLGVLPVLAKSRVAALVRTYLPLGVLAVMLVLAGYAYFLRVPGGALAPHDADALRTFAQFYLSPLGLAAAMLGLVVVMKRSFWPNLAFLATVIVFSCMFFYKIRVVPEHFWAARRFLAVVLPGACLLIGAVTFSQISIHTWSARYRRGLGVVMVGAGVVIVAILGVGYFQATMPILNHVEYAGLIPKLESLDSQIQDTDLVLVESRQVLRPAHTRSPARIHLRSRRPRSSPGQPRPTESQGAGVMGENSVSTRPVRGRWRVVDPVAVDHGRASEC